MGLDPGSMMLISSLVGAGSDIFGSMNQASTNNTNLNAAQARYGQLQDFVSRAYQPGINPYSQAIMNFTGQGLPPGASANGFGVPTSAQSQQQYQQIGNQFVSQGNLPGGIGSGRTYDAGTSLPSGQGGPSYSASGSGLYLPGHAPAPNPYANYTQQQLWNIPYASMSPDQIQQRNARQADLSRVAMADNNYGVSGGFNGTDAGRISVNGVAGGPQWNAQTGQFETPGQNNGSGGPSFNFMPGASSNNFSIPDAPFDANPATQVDPSSLYGISPSMIGQTFTGLPGDPGYTQSSAQSNGMYRYSSPGADTYSAATIGSFQGQNPGQDSLLQMMNKPLALNYDPSLIPNLQDINSGNTQFNNSDLFKSLQPMQQFALDKQVGQLHASAGSLGERFGAAMGQNEALLRSQTQNAINAQNAQIAQSSFENAQNRRLQSLGTTAQLGTAAGGQALSAAQSAASNEAQRLFGNANILNSASQFNAGQNTAERQFTAGQGNIYNQNVLGAYGQAGNFQAQQYGQNSQLLGLLAGIGLPQAQASPIPGAISDASSTLGFLPYMMSILGGGKSGAQFSPPPSYQSPTSSYQQPYYG